MSGLSDLFRKTVDLPSPATGTTVALNIPPTPTILPSFIIRKSYLFYYYSQLSPCTSNYLETMDTYYEHKDRLTPDDAL